MDINNILLASASLGTMGLAFGAGLAFASKKFAVEIDPRVEAINEVLPGANCGGCGFPGCGGFAVAVVAGEAPVNGCPVGGPDCAQAIAGVMGLEAATGAKQVAKVLCAGTSEHCKENFIYDGVQDCKAAHMISGGSKSCQYGCLGLGTCERACPFDAIVMNEGGIAEIDKDKCTACGKCLEVCPKSVIGYVPYDQNVIVDCNNMDRGGHVKKNCGIACIACKMCVKACPFDAIDVENNIAKIDYEKCTNCGLCYDKCPTKAIEMDESKRLKAVVIEEACIGCTLCKKVCPVDAIAGEVKQKHKVDPEKCIGCSACEAKCPKDAIIMK